MCPSNHVFLFTNFTILYHILAVHLVNSVLMFMRIFVLVFNMVGNESALPCPGYL